jgi:hypothetical protein
MIQLGRWRRRLTACLLAVGVLGFSGCLCYLHPIAPAPLAYTQACHVAPKCARDHVYVFFVHGMDPFDYANMTGVRDYVQELGFHKTFYGQLYHTPHFEREIRRIHHEDPDAHFVLLGFSFGTNMVRSIAQAVKEDGIHIDLLVYCGGNTLHDTERDQPSNAGRILNILAWGFIWNGDTMSQAENINVTDVWHFGSPSHPTTLEWLARELAVVSAAVPVVEPPDPGVPAGPAGSETPEMAPTPRPVTPATAERDEWDYLKPVSRLEPTVARPAATPPRR